MNDKHFEGTPVSSNWKDYSAERCPECGSVVKLPLDGNEVPCPECGVMLCLLYEED